MTKENQTAIDNLDLKGLEKLCEREGLKPFRASQLYQWIHKKGASSFSEMSNISKDLRAELAEKYSFTTLELIGRQASKLDGSVKYLFGLEDGNRVESVLLADSERLTACVSTQVGCRMGCKFCSTAEIGLIRNLTTGEIIRQIHMMNKDLPEGRRITNLVFMGMGEPLDNVDNVICSLEIITDEAGLNFSHNKTTVSTCGLTKNLRKLFDMERPVNIAVSINAPDDELRKSMMPVTGKYPLKELVAELKALPMQKRKRTTIEYILFKDINDTPAHARALIKLLNGLKVKVNLIRYNTHVSGGYEPSTEKATLKFQEILLQSSISTYLRKSLGSDIDGACGQLYAGYSNGGRNAE